MERKTLKFEIKSVDEEQGIIEGYGATFSNVPDSYGDVIEEGAFTKTLQENGNVIVSLFNHDVNLPIGMPELIQDKKGLFTRIKLVRGVQKAEETLLLAKAGVLKRMSIGYETVKADVVNGVRHLKEVKLFDVSPVVFAANLDATITNVKSEQGIASLQALLKTEAKGAVNDTLDAEELEAAELDGALAELQATIEGFDAREAEARIDEILAQL